MQVAEDGTLDGAQERRLQHLKYGKSYSQDGPHSPHLLRRGTEQDRRVFSWLSPTFFDVEDAYESTIELIHPSTCAWIESIDSFKSWFLSDSPAVLGILAGPGYGKTVLASKIIRSIKGSPQVEGNRPPPWNCDLPPLLFRQRRLRPHYWENLYDVPQPLAYMFCEALSIEERTPKVILSVLLAQLCRQNSELLAAVTSKMEEFKSVSASTENLIAIFREDVARHIRRYYLVIDGLDRAANCSELLLSLISKESKNGPKVLILSSPSQEIISKLQSHPTFEITPRHIEQDIQAMLLTQINEVVRARGSSARPKIEELFQAGNHGSFLWCKILKKYLETQSLNISSAWLSNVGSQLPPSAHTVPTSVKSLYLLVLKAISKEPDHFKRDVIVRALAWIAIAQRPLDIEELSIALSVTKDEGSFLFDERLLLLPQLLDICTPLLDNRTSMTHGSMWSTAFSSYSLIHITLEDLLFSVTSPETIALGLPLNRAQLHAHAADVCISYLSLPDLDKHESLYGFHRGTDLRPGRAELPAVEGFLSYAAVYLPVHMSFSDRDDWPDSIACERASRLVKAWEAKCTG